MHKEINAEDIKNICNKTARQRSSVEIQYLAEITSNLKLFKQLNDAQGPYSHIICCRYLKYEFCESGKHLFKFGEQGTRFYIIVAGRVGVEVPMNDARGDVHMVEVMVLSSGSGFGELALESSKPRAASIRCKVPSHFMYLEKSDYNRLISRMVTDRRMALVDFIKSLPPFEHLTRGKLTKLSYIFKEKVITKGQTLYAEQDPGDSFYIIKEGDFEFFRTIPIKVRKSSSALQKEILFKKKKVANLGKGELFGELEMIENIPRKDSCKCTSSKALIFEVSKSVSKRQDFSKQLNSEEIASTILVRMKEKENAIQERIKVLKSIDEKILKHDLKVNKFGADDEEDEKKVGRGGGKIRARLSLDDRLCGYRREDMRKNEGRLSIDESRPKIKKTLTFVSLPELSLTKENSGPQHVRKLSLKTFHGFRHKKSMMEKFIPQSLNQDLFESKFYLHISTNNQKSISSNR